MHDQYIPKYGSKFLLSLIILFLFNTSCGLFIRSPLYETKSSQSIILLDSPLCLSDSTCLFIDNRINKESEYIIIALHGLGAHAGTFLQFQNYSDKKGISTIAFDFRGFGHWNGQKGDIKNIGQHITDLHELIESVQYNYPSKKLLLIGESLGSSLAIWYSILHPNNIDGLILTSLVTSNGSEDVKVGTILRLLKAYIFSPAKPVRLSYNSSLYSNDSVYLNHEFIQDTLGSHAISPKYLIQSNRVIKKSRLDLCDLQIPVLIIQGGEDFLSTQEKTLKYIARCSSPNIDYIYFPNMKHSIVNDKNRTIAFDKISNWIDNMNM